MLAYQDVSLLHAWQEATDAAENVDAEDVSTADMHAAARSSGWLGGLSSLKGQALILGTAVLWGTNPPAVRYLYTSGGKHESLVAGAHALRRYMRADVARGS